jgi:putative transposase
MVRIRRIQILEQLYFITNVTFNRHPIIVTDIDIFWNSIESVCKRVSFELFAWVILPEHFHALIIPKQGDISDIMKRIKLSFSMDYRKRHKLPEGRIWQRGFWDHMIRNDEDLKRHLDYIHYNPVKHGLVKSAHDWPHSSIHKFKEDYPKDWGIKPEFDGADNFGE